MRVDGARAYAPDGSRAWRFAWRARPSQSVRSPAFGYSVSDWRNVSGMYVWCPNQAVGFGMPGLVGVGEESKANQLYSQTYNHMISWSVMTAHFLGS